MKPQLLRIGNRIVNLETVQYMTVENENLVNVHFSPEHMIQFSEDEAGDLLALLEVGYINRLSSSAAG